MRIDYSYNNGARAMTTKSKMKPILVTTQHRGVFAGLVPVDQDLTAKTMSLKSAYMAIYFGTTKGVHELCDTGPTNKSRISAKADIPVLHDITAVFDITPDAWKAWETA